MMRDRIRIKITSAYLNVSPEDLDAAAGDAARAAQNELGFIGLEIFEAEVYEYDPEPEDEGDVVSLEAHPELSDEDVPDLKWVRGPFDD